MYEAHLGVMYLMRENWKCAEIGMNQTECKKFRKYLDILYGYLFRVYAAGTGAAAAQIVKPVFKVRKVETQLKDKVVTKLIDGTLIEILEKLSQLSFFFFVPDTTLNEYTKPKLSNEGEMIYALNAANSNAANSNDTLRKQFDQKLKEMMEKTKKNEAKEKAELCPGRDLIDYQKFKNSAYGASFNIFLYSPFMSVGLDDPDSDYCRD